jgi:hypothetical protein
VLRPAGQLDAERLVEARAHRRRVAFRSRRLLLVSPDVRGGAAGVEARDRLTPRPVDGADEALLTTHLSAVIPCAAAAAWRAELAR